MSRCKGITDDIPNVALLTGPPLLQEHLVAPQDLLELGQVGFPLLHRSQSLRRLNRGAVQQLRNSIHHTLQIKVFSKKTLKEMFLFNNQMGRVKMVTSDGTGVKRSPVESNLSLSWPRYFV